MKFELYRFRILLIYDFRFRIKENANLRRENNDMNEYFTFLMAVLPGQMFYHLE